MEKFGFVMTVKLFLDLGNSYLKWGIYDGSVWLRQSFGSYDQLDESFRKHLLFYKPTCIEGAKVGHSAHEELVRNICLETLNIEPTWKSSEKFSANGVTNSYDEPCQLGSDRWFSLIAVQAMSYSDPCIIVSCGTATTVDALLPSGLFLGGFILPGFGLMDRALKKYTANLNVSVGSYALWPKNTRDALVSGSTNAHIGLILHAQRMLERQTCIKVRGIVTGGGASRVHQYLDESWKIHPFLVLQGLLEDHR
jgi:type III pantothenate kinase